MPPHGTATASVNDAVGEDDEQAELNYYKEMRLGISAVEIEVEGMVACEASLDEVKHKLVPPGSTMLDEEKEMLEALYTCTLLGSIPDRLATFFEALFSKSTEECIFDWLESCVNGLTEEVVFGLFERTGDSKFAQNLQAVHALVPRSGIVKFLRDTRRLFLNVFEKRSGLIGELGLYRSVRVCATNIPRSRLFCTAVQNMWRRCIDPAGNVAITPEDGAEEHMEHVAFDQIVNGLTEDFQLRHEFVREAIKSSFVALKCRVFNEGGNRVLEFSGRQLLFSLLHEDVDKKLIEDPSITELRLVAETAVCIDEDLTLQAKCVSIIAPAVNVLATVEWNLSGGDSKEDADFKPKAGDGMSRGENGDDGADGIAGQSSGHIYIKTEEIVHSSSWNVKLCGGDGTRGQNGGNGAQGKNGVGRNFDDVFGSFGAVVTNIHSKLATVTGFGFFGRAIAKGVAAVSNAVTGSELKVRDFSEKVMNDGVRYIDSLSERYGVQHEFKAYIGSPGLPGGHGGRNGCGGDGGKAGKFEARKPNGQRCQHKVAVVAQKGKDGPAGNPGQDGKWGMAGHDVVTGFSATQFYWRKYGTEKNDKKVEIKFVSENLEEAYYVPSRYTGSGSACYITAVDIRPVNQTVLAGSEKYGEKKKDAERQGQAIAKTTNAINTEAIEGAYDQVFTAKMEETTLQQTNEETTVETEAQMNRLAIRVDIPQEGVYESKPRIKLPLVSIESHQLILNHPEELHTSSGLFKAPINEEMARQLAIVGVDDEVRPKLWKKLVITAHRDMAKRHRSSHGQFSAAIREFVRQRKAVKTKEMQLLQVSRDAREARRMEINHRDCSAFLQKSSVDHSGTHACIDILFDSNRSKTVVAEALHSALIVCLIPDTFKKVVALFDKWKELKLRQKTLDNHILAFERIVQCYEDGATGFAETELAVFNTKSSPDELKILKKVWAKTKKKQPECDQQNYENLHVPFLRKSKFRGLFKPTLSPRFVHAFVRLYQTIITNRALFQAFRYIAGLTSSDEAYVKNSDFLGDQARVDLWLQVLGNAKLRDEYSKLIEEYGAKTAAGRALIAWNLRVNLRFYCGGRLVEDHFPDSPLTYHCDISPATGDFTWLNFNRDALRLLHERDRHSEKFTNALEENGDLKILGIVPGSFQALFTTPAIRRARLAKKIDDVVYAVRDTGYMRHTLELFVGEFAEHAEAFMEVLLAIFDVDGVFIDAEDILFMVDTAMRTCSVGLAHPWYFATMLLQDSQDEWLDAFFLVNVENVFRRKVKRIAEFRQRCRRIVDNRIKILCAQKMTTEAIEEDDLLELLALLKDAHGAFRELITVPLAGWTAVVAESHVFYLLIGRCGNLNEHMRNTLVFWCLKIGEAYGIEEAQNVQELLVEQCFPVCNDDFMLLRLGDRELKMTFVALSCLIQHLCNRELETRMQLSPTKIFKMLCSLVVDGPELKTKFRKIEISAEEKEDVGAILCQLCSGVKIERGFSKLFQLIRHNNLNDEPEEGKKANDGHSPGEDTSLPVTAEQSTSGTTPTSVVNERQNHRRRFFDGLEVSLTKHLDALAETAREFFSQVSTLKKKMKEPMKPAGCRSIIKDLRPDESSEDEMLLAIVDEAILMKRGFRLRNNQKVAILGSLRSGELSRRGLLQQIATGEGKSLIITSLAIISALRGQIVHIVTSSSTLAKRDTESARGCTDIYELFGIAAAHICVENPSRRREVYASCQIVYGDLTSFQRDYLLDKFYGMNIMGQSAFVTLLVDEVDSMLLDQGNNMLYLSHEIPDLEFLQSLFVSIWQTVCTAIAAEMPFKTPDVVEGLRQQIFPSLPLQYLGQYLNVDIIQATNIHNFLLANSIVDKSGVILDESLEHCKKRLEGLKDAKLTSRLLFCIEAASKAKLIPIPPHLRSFVSLHLEDFVWNAKNAYFMEEGRGYQVDIARSDGSLAYEPKVIIVDQGTGVDLPSTQWSNGLHQFLQLKHGLRLTSMSLKAVFVSNVSFMKKYDRIYGFSGTLGAAAEQEQLRKLYSVECTKLPSSVPKLLHEDCSVVENARESYVECVFGTILKMIQRRRSVLVICESVKEVNALSAEVRMEAKKKLEKSSHLLVHFQQMILYKRDRDPFAYGDGDKQLECCRIVFATNLAGRGTDIKLCDELVAKGGLHVIIAFLPDNVRVEEQAFGRAARCGEPGSAQLLVYNDDGRREANISRLKMHRNAVEAKRVLAITNFYEGNIKVEEDCFNQFTDCFDRHRLELEKRALNDVKKQLLLRDLLDRWAYWLDGQTKSNVDGSKQDEGKSTAVVVAAGEFCSQLGFDDYTPTQPMNRLRWGIEQLLDASKESMKEAATHFDVVQQDFSFYSPEAQYYKAFVLIKDNRICSSTDAPFLAVRCLFEAAKHAFDQRIQQCYGDRAVVEHYKEEKAGRHFIVDLFSKQQMEKAQMYHIFIASIESLLGGRLSHEDLMSTFVTEEAASAVFDRFTDLSFFQQLPIRSMRFRSDFETANLDAFAGTQATSSKVIREKLMQLKKKNSNVKFDDFLEIFQSPTREAFWEKLRGLGCLADETQHIFVNKGKLANLSAKISEKVGSCYLAVNAAEKFKNPVEDKTLKDGINDQNQSNENKAEEKKKAEDFSTTLWLYKCGDLNHFHELDATKLQKTMSVDVVNRLIALKVIVKNRCARFVQSNRVLRPAVADPTKMEQLMAFGRKLFSQVQEIKEVPKDSPTVNVEDFESCSYLKDEDFETAGIPKDEARDLVAVLVASGVLVLDGDKLRLVEKANLTMAHGIPQCYLPLLVNLLKKKTAFVCAYRSLLTAIEEKSQLTLELPSKSDVERELIDLIDIGVFEFSNVNFEALKANQVGDNDLRDIWRWMKDGDESRNISTITKTVMIEYTQEVLSGDALHEWKRRQQLLVKAWQGFVDTAKKTYDVGRGVALKMEEAHTLLYTLPVLDIDKWSATVVKFASTELDIPDRPKRERGPYDDLGSSATTAAIVGIFRDKSGMQKFKTVDAALVALWDKMAEAGLYELRFQSLYVNHGATHVINVIEQRWSYWSMVKLGVVTLVAAVELTVGALLLIFTAGTGIAFANAFISEGISDLLYVIQGLYTGHPSSYRQHKLFSVAATMVLCGAATWYSWGKEFNPIGFALKGQGSLVTNAAGATVNLMTLSGKELFKHIGSKVAGSGFKVAFKEAANQITRRLASAVLNSMLFQAIQWGTKSLIEMMVKAFRSKAVAAIEWSTNEGGKLLETFRYAIESLGVEKGKKVVNECCNYVLADSTSAIGYMCDVVFKQYRPILQSFTSGANQGMAHGGGDVQSKLVARIERFLQLATVIIAADTLRELLFRIKSLTGNIITLIRSKVESIEKSAETAGKEKEKVEEPEEGYDELSKHFLDSWHQKMGEQLDKLIEQRIVTPLLALATAKLQTMLENAIAKSYRKYQEKRDGAKVDKAKKEYQAEKEDKTIGEEQAKKNFMAKLEGLMETISPDIMARLIVEGVKIDMTTASATANVLAKKFGGAFEFEITNEDGEAFLHSAGTSGEGISPRRITIDLRNLHYGKGTTQSGINSCLFDELCAQIPEFKLKFANDAEFRKELAEIVSTDPYFRRHIENGWHIIGVQRGYLGGDAPQQLRQIQVLDVNSAQNRLDDLKELQTTASDHLNKQKESLKETLLKKGVSVEETRKLLDLAENDPQAAADQLRNLSVDLDVSQIQMLQSLHAARVSADETEKNYAIGIFETAPELEILIKNAAGNLEDSKNALRNKMLSLGFSAQDYDNICKDGDKAIRNAISSKSDSPPEVQTAHLALNSLIEYRQDLLKLQRLQSHQRNWGVEYSQRSCVSNILADTNEFVTPNGIKFTRVGPNLVVRHGDGTTGLDHIASDHLDQFRKHRIWSLGPNLPNVDPVLSALQQYVTPGSEFACVGYVRTDRSGNKADDFITFWYDQRNPKVVLKVVPVECQELSEMLNNTVYEIKTAFFIPPNKAEKKINAEIPNPAHPHVPGSLVGGYYNNPVDPLISPRVQPQQPQPPVQLPQPLPPPSRQPPPASSQQQSSGQNVP